MHAHTVCLRRQISIYIYIYICIYIYIYTYILQICMWCQEASLPPPQFLMSSNSLHIPNPTWSRMSTAEMLPKTRPQQKVQLLQTREIAPAKTCEQNTAREELLLLQLMLQCATSCTRRVVNVMRRRRTLPRAKAQTAKIACRNL